ncbi:MAG: T9SS type A sorting domain-containing protein [bacterium]
MKIYIIVLVAIGSLFATTRYNNGGGRAFEIKIHNINQVEMCISNFGKFGQTEGGEAGYWWPKGSGHQYIFGAGIWFGTVDSGTGDTLVTIGYGPHGGETEFVPGLEGMSINHPDAIIFMHPENWPAPDTALPMAPQDTVSHEDSWCCMNDCDSNAHVPGDTRPINIEMYQTGYAWDIPQIEDIVFLTYEIKNVSGHGLYDCYVGIAADNDIGNEAGTGNDIISGIVGQWYYIAGESLWVDAVGYQWQNEMEPSPSPPWWPGALAFDLLETPLDLVEGQDKDNDGILDQYERDSSYYWNNLPQSMWDVDHDNVPDWRDASENPQYGMTAFKRFTLNAEPNIDAERYLTLAGYDFQTGIYNPYDTAPPMPDDQRFLMSSGPFDVPADSSIFMVFAVMLTDWDSLQVRPDTAVALIDKWAQLWYDMYWFLYTGIEEEYSHKVSSGLLITPNPVSGIAQVSFTTLRAGVLSVKLYNAAGQVVKDVVGKYVQAGLHEIDVDTRGLAQGTYFIIVETPDYKLSRSLVVLR